MDTKFLRSYISNILIKSINENDYRGDFSRGGGGAHRHDKNFTCSDHGHSNGFIDSFGDYMTFPEFLEIYGNRSHMDRLFNELMG